MNVGTRTSLKLFLAAGLTVAGTATSVLALRPLVPREAGDEKTKAEAYTPPPIYLNESPPKPSEPLYFYFEGAQRGNLVSNDPFWALLNTRFQFRCDTRQDRNNAWTGPNFPGELNPDQRPADFFRPYAGPEEFARQVVNIMESCYRDTASVWPSNKPREHGFELIGPNGASSPWQEEQNVDDFIDFGGQQWKKELTNVVVNAAARTISSPDLWNEANLPWGAWNPNEPDWRPHTTYASDREVLTYGGSDPSKQGILYYAKGGGTSGDGTDSAGHPLPWGASDVYDNTIHWVRIDTIAVIGLEGFANANNNGYWVVDRKPTPTTFHLSYRLGTAGTPWTLTQEAPVQSMAMRKKFAPEIWHRHALQNSGETAFNNFVAVFDALNTATFTVDAGPNPVARTFVHYVEDEESANAVVTDSADGPHWAIFNPYQSNMDDWANTGFWQTCLAMPDGNGGLLRSSFPVDGQFTVDALLERAASIIHPDTHLLDEPVHGDSYYSPVQTTNRVWTWIENRARASIRAQSRNRLFRDIFGQKIPCGNWNSWPLGGEPASRIIIEPHGGEPTTGLGVDDYAGAESNSISIPAMYWGVLGDYRGHISNNNLPNFSDPRWSTEQNWTAEALAHGVDVSSTPEGSIARGFQIGEIALREFAVSVKTNYGPEHQIMPSLTFRDSIVNNVGNLQERAWIVQRLARTFADAYQDGLIDKVWIFEPSYGENSAVRELWYRMASETFRLSGKRADYNYSGTIEVDDIFKFLSKFNAQDPAGDFNEDGVFNAQDVNDFLSAYFAG